MLAGRLRILLVLGYAGAGLVIGPPARAQESAPAASAPTARPYPTGLTCVWMPSLRSQFYTVLDDQHLVIDSAPKGHYLITLARRCFDLDTTLDIGLAAHGDQLCSGDAILIGRDRCTIQYIEAVASEAEAKEIVAGRKAAEKAKSAGGN